MELPKFVYTVTIGFYIDKAFTSCSVFATNPTEALRAATALLANEKNKE